MDGYEPKHQWILTVKIAPRSSNVLGSALERSISISIMSFYMIQIGYTNLCLISPARTCGSVVHVLYILQQTLQNAYRQDPRAGYDTYERQGLFVRVLFCDRRISFCLFE